MISGKRLTGGIKPPHRYRPGTVALREISSKPKSVKRKAVRSRSPSPRGNNKSVSRSARGLVSN